MSTSIRTSANPVYDATVSGKKCEEHAQQIICDYRVGKSLHFSIVGIGNPDVGVTFMRSDFHGDYYATYGLLHGCVIVKAGKALHSEISRLGSFAFVSPLNGKVYRTWEECQARH